MTLDTIVNSVPRSGGPRTALDLLMARDQYPPAVIVRYMSVALSGDVRASLGQLPAGVREPAVREIATKAAGLLNIRLPDLIATGWRKQRELTEAARRTLSVPGSTELVELASHRISASQEPHINVLVDGECVARIRFELLFLAEVGALVATVEAGRLVTLSAASCDIGVALSIQDIRVATGAGQIEPTTLISLRDGIRLLPARAYPDRGRHGDPGQDRQQTA